MIDDITFWLKQVLQILRYLVLEFDLGNSMDLSGTLISVLQHSVTYTLGIITCVWSDMYSYGRGGMMEQCYDVNSSLLGSLEW